jgi:hypothetical protein
VSFSGGGAPRAAVRLAAAAADDEEAIEDVVDVVLSVSMLTAAKNGGWAGVVGVDAHSGEERRLGRFLGFLAATEMRSSRGFLGLIWLFWVFVCRLLRLRRREAAGGFCFCGCRGPSPAN